MIRILLIRHGETELTGRVLYGRMPGVHLSQEGCRQAQALSQALQIKYEIEQIVSSPLERTLETAGYLAEALKLPILTDTGFVELDYGHWMGMTFEEIRQTDEWQHYNRVRSLSSPPQGELMMQVQARAWTALESVLLQFAEKQTATVAIITHGDVIRGLLILLLGMPLDHIHRFEVSPASLSEVVFDGKYARVVRINQVFH